MSSDDLEARLRLAEHRLAILEIEGKYGLLFDSGRAEEYADLYTEDGVHEIRQQSEGDEPNVFLARGREELVKLCRDFPLAGIHLLHVPQISIDGDTASVRVHMQFLAQTTASGEPAFSTMVGYYDVAYVLQGDRWKIKRRVNSPFRRATSDGFAYPPTSALG